MLMTEELCSVFIAVLTGKSMIAPVWTPRGGVAITPDFIAVMADKHAD